LLFLFRFFFLFHFKLLRLFLLRLSRTLSVCLSCLPQSDLHHTWFHRFAFKQHMSFADLNRVARWYIFRPKIAIWVKVWRALQWKMLVYFMDIWSILRPFDIFCDHLIYI
jgi:hypothetical protein